MPFQLIRKTLKGEQERPQSHMQPAPVVYADELSELVVEPDTALAISRGRGRRDGMS